MDDDIKKIELTHRYEIPDLRFTFPELKHKHEIDITFKTGFIVVLWMIIAGVLLCDIAKIYIK